MSSEGEKTCPMCTEAMDLTDQQLKPCKCGYEICVWCWHNIIEMAEKEDTVGRCPACRTPYDKARILAMTISSERMAELNSVKKQQKCKDIKQPAEVNHGKQEKVQKKYKEISRPAEKIYDKKIWQKAKIKPLDVRSHLTDVRVVQRNIVYIAGWPVSLANEETCRKKEFMGQYGNVKRVDVIRTDVSKKHYPATCVLFIAFSKEEEAIRCIQTVNGYILDGRPLRACFGATGYCKAWLKNLRCVNPDCLFLHHVGSQEDMCNRHEVTQACASKLQRTSGIAYNNFKRNSGRCLPPPVDNRSTSDVTTGNPQFESARRSPIGDAQSLDQNVDTRRSGALPITTSCELRSASEEPSNCHSISSTSFLSSTDTEDHMPAQDVSKSFSKSTMDSSTLMGRVVDDCLTNSTLSTGLSAKELWMFHRTPSGCGSQDLEFQSMEYNSVKPSPVRKDVVHGPELLAKVNEDSRENGSVTKKAIEESKEDKVTSDMFSLNIGLVEPHLLANQSGDAKDSIFKGLEIEMSLNTEFRVMSAVTENSDTETLSSSSLYSNGFYQGKSSVSQDSGWEKAVDTNKPLFGEKAVDSSNTVFGLTAYDSKCSEVPKNSHNFICTNIARESQLTPNVYHSASPVSRPLLPPVPRPPPGFLPRHAGDCDQPFIPVYYGSTDQYEFRGYRTPANSFQELSRSNYTGSERHDPAIMAFGTETLQQSAPGLNSCSRGSNLASSAEMNGHNLSANMSFSRDMLPQSTLGLNSCNWGSNLATSSEMDRRRHLQLTLGNLIQNSNTSQKLVDNIRFEEGMKNYHGQWESSRGGSTFAAAPCVTGASYSGTAATNQQAPRVGSTFAAAPPVTGVSYSGTATAYQQAPNQKLVDHGQWESSRVGSTFVASPCVSGASYSGTATTNQQAPNLQRQSAKPFYDPEFEASNFSYFSYSQYKKT